MKQYFHCIGIVGYPRNSNAFSTHKVLYNWLKKKISSYYRRQSS